MGQCISILMDMALLFKKNSNRDTEELFGASKLVNQPGPNVHNINFLSEDTRKNKEKGEVQDDMQ